MGEKVGGVGVPQRVGRHLLCEPGASWALVVTSRDRDGKPHDILLSRAELIADYKWLERWASHGFSTPSHTKGKAILRQELLEATCDKRVRLVPRTGWHGNVFVLPNATYGASEEVYRYAGDARGVLYGQKGTLDEWRIEVAARATGNSRLILGMSLAFSGPLFDLLEVEPIGAHFEGRKLNRKVHSRIRPLAAYGAEAAAMALPKAGALPAMALKALLRRILARCYAWKKLARSTLRKSVLSPTCFSTATARAAPARTVKPELGPNGACQS